MSTSAEDMNLKSVNPLTRESYDIPDGSDRDGIDRFIEANSGKKIVVIQGLGFVGAAMALVCADANLSLIHI